MKKLFFLSLIFSNISFSQEESNFNSRISFISKNKDTLILPNDELGILVAQSWDLVTSEAKPKIIFATINYINTRNFYIRKEQDF